MEGEYLNGKYIKGYLRKYDHEGNLLFEGDFVDVIKTGKGKQYNNKRELIFEGEYLYGEKIKGKAYLNGRLEYQGEYLNKRKYNGKGYNEKIYELNNDKGTVKEYYDNGELEFE